VPSGFVEGSWEPIKVAHAWIVIELSASPLRYDCHYMGGIDASALLVSGIVTGSL
jgi:hypothetical protein